MNTAVRFFTRSGNTKKLASAIGAALGVPALPITEPLTETADLLFLGGSVYGGGVDKALAAFIDTLSPEKVKKAAVFSTAAVVRSAYPALKALLEAKGIPVEKQEYHCRGRFLFLHPRRPNDKDCAAAAAFAVHLARES
jgi:flavodoxin